MVVIFFSKVYEIPRELRTEYSTVSSQARNESNSLFVKEVGAIFMRYVIQELGLKLVMYLFIFWR